MKQCMYIPPKRYSVISTTLCAKTWFHCASASKFRNKNLLTDIRSSSTITFTGIGGSIEVTQLLHTMREQHSTFFPLILFQNPPSLPTTMLRDGTRCRLKIRPMTSREEGITSSKISSRLTIIRLPRLSQYRRPERVNVHEARSRRSKASQGPLPNDSLSVFQRYVGGHLKWHPH